VEGTTPRNGWTKQHEHSIGKGSHTLRKETPKPQLPSTPDAVQETPQYSQQPRQQKKKKQ
jgi:hypothetical protein